MVIIGSTTFLLSSLCAALMGNAIQRGATCTVAAVAEVAHKGTFRRLVALGEAALWVAGGLLVALALGVTAALPSSFVTTVWTILGAIMLGIGAWINGACVFGAIARFGSGEWSYAFTPLGFYVGALSLSSLFPNASPVPHATTWSPPAWLAIAFVVFACGRLLVMLRTVLTGGRAFRQVWAPHEATVVIGIAFTIMFICVGAWAYMDILFRLAQGMTANLGWRLILFGALLAGAILGGWTEGKLASRVPTWRSLSRCFAGGTLMGWGSALIPGSNDGLILIGLPLLMPYAWVAVFTMVVTIWVALVAERHLKRSVQF